VETQLPSPKKGQSHQFSAHFYCGQTAGCIKMPLGTKVGLSPGDFVLDGDPATPHQKGRSSLPIFGPFLLWTNGWMHQDATWYGAQGTLLDGDPRPPLKGRSTPIFGPCLLWSNGWMDQDGTSHGGRPQSRRLSVRWGPSPAPKKGASPPQVFGPCLL